MANQGGSSKSRQREASYARQRQAHDVAAIRRAEDRERQAAQRHAADAMLKLQAKWGTRVDALKRLTELSRTIDRLRRDQLEALVERDELIAQLREVGESWNSLASRTGLSRQALNKRVQHGSTELQGASAGRVEWPT
ncbi:hypothetical protein [Leifsonia sp. AG29]|uniref:hypothetical protein n=1 Tax=Leifsonia sp. AG29 TaxID=2598860 RepID=UPI00131D2159|nr:hypothetical protein [Leifsonia sp. AG29]